MYYNSHYCWEKSIHMSFCFFAFVSKSFGVYVLTQNDFLKIKYILKGGKKDLELYLKGVFKWLEEEYDL